MKQFLPLGFLVLAGCPVNLDTGGYPTKPPRAEDVVGVYRPTPETIRFVEGKGGYPRRDVSIALNADGTCRIANIPDWWRDPFGKPAGDCDSGSGKWEVVKHQDWYEIGFDFSSSEDLQTSQKVTGGLSRSVPLVGNQPPFVINLYVGDPDSGNVMTFRREGPTQPK